jgi:hypothetical protein
MNMKKKSLLVAAEVVCVGILFTATVIAAVPIAISAASRVALDKLSDKNIDIHWLNASPFLMVEVTIKGYLKKIPSKSELAALFRKSDPSKRVAPFPRREVRQSADEDCIGGDTDVGTATSKSTDNVVDLDESGISKATA